MLCDKDIKNLMQMALEGDRERLTTFLKGLSPMERRYFDGFVDGYAEATRHVQAAYKDDGGKLDKKDEKNA